MDGSQDEIFEGFNKINEQSFIENDFSKLRRSRYE